jgi:S1-C subfamily serine protease
MRTIITLLLSILLSPWAYSQAVSDSAFITNQVYPAVVLLYSQDETGSMKMHCTATAIEKNPAGYVFVTAAHCASEDDVEKKRVQADVKKFFFVTFDERKDKTFVKAKLLACGYQHAGDDFCLFQVDSQAQIPVMPVGKDPVRYSGEAIANVASPLGLGKQVFRGTVSSPDLDRDVRVNDINWQHTVLLQLPGTDGGSSGSAVVCLEQRAICAFLVGIIDDTQIVAIPASRLVKFRQEVDSKTYKYWKAEDQD